MPTPNLPINDVVKSILGENGMGWLGTCVYTDPSYFLEELGKPRAVRHPTEVLKHILESGDMVFSPRMHPDETDPAVLARAEKYGIEMQTVYETIGGMSDTEFEPHVVASWARCVALSETESRR